MGWFSNLLRPELIATPKTRQELFRFYAGRSLTRATEAQRTQCRAQLHDLFASKTWSQLDYDTKCQAVQALEQDFAYQQHRPPKQVIPTKTPYFGYWSPQDNAIHINTDLLSQGKLSNSLWENPMPDANFQVFDTIAHEGYHAYQSYALQHPNIHADKAQLRQWALNQGKYYPDGNRYYIQPTERDAWKYGHNATTEAFAGIEARNGPEPADSKQEYLDHAQACSYDNRLAQ